MTTKPVLALLLLLSSLGQVHADPAKLDLHGLALGMTADQATAAARLPCSKPLYTNDLECRDTGDGSNYKATFSAGDPSVVLSVQRSFCSHEQRDSVLKGMLERLGVGPDRAHRDPNGYHVDLDGNREAILDADDGTCPDNGGAHYMVVIRDNSLINASGNRAVERAKAALH